MSKVNTGGEILQGQSHNTYYCRVTYHKHCFEKYVEKQLNKSYKAEVNCPQCGDACIPMEKNLITKIAECMGITDKLIPRGFAPLPLENPWECQECTNTNE